MRSYLPDYTHPISFPSVKLKQPIKCHKTLNEKGAKKFCQFVWLSMAVLNILIAQAVTVPSCIIFC